MHATHTVEIRSYIMNKSNRIIITNIILLVSYMHVTHNNKILLYIHIWIESRGIIISNMRASHADKKADSETEKFFSGISGYHDISRNHKTIVYSRSFTKTVSFYKIDLFYNHFS